MQPALRALRAGSLDVEALARAALLVRSVPVEHRGPDGSRPREPDRRREADGRQEDAEEAECQLPFQAGDDGEQDADRDNGEADRARAFAAVVNPERRNADEQ
jgi:hypothetical protein